MADVFYVVCGASIVSRWEAGKLFVGMVGALRGGHSAWSERGKSSYKLVVGNGKRRREVKWLTCLILFPVYAS